MKCLNCRNEIPEESAFCPFCGSHISKPAPAPAPTAAPVYTPPVYNPNPYATQSPNAPVYTAPPSGAPTYTQPTYAAPNYATPAYNAPVAPTNPAPKRKFNLKDYKRLLPFAIIGAAVLVVVILLVVLFGNKNPLIATANLVKNGNFTMTGRNSYGSRITMMVDIDYKNEDVMIYSELDGEFNFAIYDGYYIEPSYSWYGDEGYYTTDISATLEAFFEGYNSGKKLNWDELIETMNDALGGGLEDVMDLDELEKCAKTYGRKMVNKRWLKKNAGYSTERKDGTKIHIFKPDLYKFAVASVEIFEDAFEDDYDYDMIMDELKDARSEMRETKISIKLGVKGRYLRSLEISYDEGYGVDKFKFTFEDIGKTEIDVDLLEDILAMAR